MPECSNSVKDIGGKHKKPFTIDLKILMKIFFHYPPALQSKSNSSILDWSVFKNFLHRNEATIKVKNAECVAVKPKNYFEILLSAHAELQKLIFLHPKQKVVKASTYKRYCEQFWFIITRQWQETRLLNFKRPFFLAQCPQEQMGQGTYEVNYTLFSIHVI